MTGYSMFFTDSILETATILQGTWLSQIPTFSNLHSSVYMSSCTKENIYIMSSGRTGQQHWQNLSCSKSLKGTKNTPEVKLLLKFASISVLVVYYFFLTIHRLKQSEMVGGFIWEKPSPAFYP